MKKIIFYIFSLLIFGLSSFGQYGNSWIDFNKTYHKFQVNETGIYRIPTSVLSGTGMPMIGKNFQLFYKGEEIPIYVTTENVFSTGDYIEFYGEQNDGEFDTQLFATSSKQPNAELSLFTDESTYFLTSNVGTNKRYEETPNSITNAPPKLDYYMHDSYQIEKNNFHFGEPYYTAGAYSFFSTFDEGEGFVGPIIRNTYTEIDTNGDGVPDIIQENTGFNYRVFTDNVYQDAPEKARVSATVVGRNSSTAVNFDKHIAISLVKPGQLDTTVYVQDSFKKFQIKQFEFDVDIDHLNIVPDNTTGRARTKVNFRAYDGQKYGWAFETKYSLSLLKMTYPRDFDFNNEEYFEFNLDVDQTKYIEIENFNGGSDAVLYDLTEGKRYIPVVSGGVYKFKIEPEGSVRRSFLIINSGSSNSHIKEITGFTTRNFVDYDDPANRGRYLIITHESLRDGAVDQVERYKDYRESAIGGSHNVVIADIDELYDQFAWGIEKHPMAIKNYISYAYNNSPNSGKVEYVNIIGKGVRYEKTRFDDVPFDDCLVPAYGYTATDLMFTTATTQNYLPRVAIGRIPAKTSDEVRAYLDKILEYEAWITDTRTCETIQDREWMKNTIHIAKGWGTNETNNFQANLDVYKDIIEKQKLGYKIVEEFQDLTGAIPGNLDNNYQASPGIKLRMEEGLAFINYVGHSAPKVNYWQFEMLHPNTYNNEGKYPFILSNSCFVGKISDFYDKTCMGEDYTVTDNRGSIGFLAAVALSSPSFLHLFSETFIENITLDHYTESVGKNIKNTISEIYNANDDGVRIVCNEFTLAGDPAVKMYQWSDPEFFFNDNNMVIKDMAGNIIPPTQTIDPSVNPQVQIEIQVQNFGQAPETDLEISIGQYDNGSLIGTLTTETVPAPAYSETIVLTYDIQSFEGLNNLVVTLDPNGQYNEDCTEDNELMRPISVSDACAGQGVNISLVNFTNVFCASQATVALEVQDDSGNSINTSQGSLSVDGNPVTSISPSSLGEGSYNLTFNYLDPASGCPSIISESFNVIASPNASFTIDDDDICVDAGSNIADYSVIVSYDGSTPDANFDWDFDGANASPNGDGTYTLTFTEGGSYNVSLNANAGDCSDSFTDRIDLGLAPPEVEISCEINANDELEFSWDPLSAYNISDWLITINDNPPFPLDGNLGSYVFPTIIDITTVTLQSFTNGACGVGPTSTYSGECVAAQCPTVDLGLSVGSTTFCNNEAAVAITSTGTSAAYSGTGVTGNTFDPSGLPAGDYIISMQASEGCQDLTVSVNQAPNATISGPLEICEGEVATLTAPDGFSYNWEPGGLSTQTIDVTEAGDYTLTVTNNDGCPETTSVTVDVTANPSIDLSANPVSVCSGQDAIAFTANVQGGTFSGEGITSEGTFDPVAVGNGTYTITYEYNAGDCLASGEHTITVEDAPEVNLADNPTTACSGGDDITFTANISGGTFSGEGISPNGVFTPASVGAGTYTISYQYDDGGCSASGSHTITVEEAPEVNLTENPTTVCANGDNITFTANLAGGTFSGNGISSDGIFNPSIGPGTYTINYQYDDGGCSSTGEHTITVTEAPEINLANNPTTACTGSDDIIFNANLAGGTFSGNGISSDGIFTPSVGPGTYTISYQYDNGGCLSTGEHTITVTEAPEVNLADNPTTACAGGSLITFTANLAGGTFSGNGVSSDGIFNPSIGPGTYTINYQYDEGGCSSTGEHTITVTEAPEVNLADNPTTACAGSDDITFTANLTGGTFSGNGISSDGIFTPSIGPGTYTINYQYDDGECSSTGEHTITVTEAPEVNLADNPTTACAGGSPITLAANLAGGTFSGNGVSNGTFDPSVGAGTYTISYQYDDGGCSSTGEHTITVTEAPEVILTDNPTTACADDSQIAFTANLAGGTFSGAGISPDGNFDPSIGAGTYTISYQYDDGGCSSTGEHTITVTEAPSINLSANPTTACTSGAIINFTSNVNGGTFSGDGITSNGTFNPAMGAGTYNISYTYESGNCTSIGYHTIEVSEAVAIDLSNNPTETCSDAGFIQFDANVAGGTFNGFAITDDGVFDPSVGAGTYTINYTYDDGECTSTEEHIITVTVCALPCSTSPDLGFTAPTSILCEDDEAISLSVTYPGGTFSGSAGINPTSGLFTPSDAGPGTYQLAYTVVDEEECTVVEYLDLVVTPNIEANISFSSTILCPDQPIITLAGPSDADSYSYLWTPGNYVNPAIIITTPGTYTLTVSNGICEDTQSIEVSSTEEPDLGLSQYANFEGCDTEVFSFISTVPDGQFDINGTPFNGTIDGAQYPVGNYTLTYTVNVDNCTFDESVEFSIVECGCAVDVELGFSLSNSVVCIDDAPVSLSANVSGTFSGPGVDNTSQTFDPSIAGAGVTSVTFFYLDESDCEYTETQSIQVNALPDATIAGSTSLCNGGTTQLSAPDGYTSYSWSNGQSGQTIEVGESGTVSLTVIDANGCSNTSSVEVSVALPDATIAGNTSLCEGGTTQLSAPDGYTSYSWSNGQSGQTIEVGESGIVSLTVTDANGCSNTSSVEVSISANLDLGLSNNTTSFCSSDAVYNFGVTLPGGTYSGSGVNGNGDLDPSSLTPGSYDLTYQYQDGPCLYEENITFEILSAPVANISGDLTICDGSSTQLSAPDGYSSYSWSNGETGSSIVVAQAGTYSVTVANGNCTDDYTVAVEAVAGLDLGLANNQTVYCQNEGTVALTVNYAGGTFTGNGVDANGFFTASSVNAGSQAIAYEYTNPSTGCTYSESINVTVNPAPTAVIDGATSLCAGETATLSGPTGTNLQYAWSDGSAAQSIVVSQTGTYSLTVTNAEGCSESASVNVSITEQPELSIEASSLTICQGSTVSLTPNVTNTTGQFSWATAEGVIEQVGNDLLVAPTTDQQYTVTFTSDAGCVVSESVNITIATDQNPVASFVVSTPIVCTGESIELINSSVNSNSNTWVVTNTTTGEQSTLNVASPVIQTTTPGEYSVSLSITGCGTTQDEAAETIAFTVVESPSFTLIASETTICPGEEITLTATDGYDYTWSGENLSASSGSEVTASPSGVNQSFTYSVIASSGNGCEVEQFITVNVLNSTEVLISSSATAICEPTEVVLSVFGTGNFEWSGEGLGSTTGNEVTAFVTETTTYDVLLETPEGCSEYGTITIEYSEPEFDLETNSSITACEGEEITLALGNFDESLTYTWSGEGLQSSNGEVVTAIIGNSDVTYKVFASNGICEKELSVDVTVNALPEVSIESSEGACDGEIISLSAVGDGTSYSWTGEGLLETEGEVVSAMLNGQTTFTVTAINDNNCSTTAEVNILPSQAPTFELVATSQSVCAGSTLELVASGDGSNSYTWSGAELDNTEGSTVNATFSTVGTDSILVTAFNDASNCITEQVMYFTVSESAVFTVEAPTTVCSGEETVLTVSEDSGADYTWIGDGLMNNAGASVTAIVTQSQEFEVISNQGTECEYSQKFSIDVFESSNLQIYTNTDTVCVGTEIELNATGGETYEWVNNSIEDSGSPDQTVTINEPTLYVLEAVDANGCSNKAEIKIEISDPDNCEEEEVEPPVTEIPNVITPNGDGMNDSWKIDEFLLSPETNPNREVFIYNRWGQLVYNKVGYMDEWRGTYNDDGELPDATYYYIIKLGDENDTILTGNVTILRN